MRYHINKLEDEYQVVANETGNVEINISKRLPNAWYLVQTCMSLLLINADSKPSGPAQ